MNGSESCDLPQILSMESIEEKETIWLVPKYIPAGQINIVAGDGGSGKTTIWSALAAAISTGGKVFFDTTPFDEEREPQRVLFFSSEDSLEYTLRARLRKAGADLSNIFTVSLQDKAFAQIKFDSHLLRDMVRDIKPALLIFDPLQAFIPSEIQMGQRNAMRNCLSPLIALGEEYGTTSLVVVHTNKRQGVFGRNRVADSADIWDIARSVLICGSTNNKDVRYLAHEKSNYDEPGPTILFRIEDGTAVYEGTSSKSDADFVRERDAMSYQAPQRMEAEDFITSFLRNGKKPTAELDEAAKAAGISGKSLERAKTSLRQKKMLSGKSEGFGKEKIFYSFLLEQND